MNRQTQVATIANQALAYGNEIRLARAAKRREIRKLSQSEGLRAIADIVENPPEYMEAVRVFDLLLWPSWMGGVRARQIWFGLAAPPWSESRRLRNLTGREIGLVACALRRQADHSEGRATTQT